MAGKKELPLLRDIIFHSIGAEGKAVARVGDMVLFVPGLIPGDIADIRVRKKKKRYMEGEAVAVKTSSPDRVKPVCLHFGTCGGCSWQHLPYELQLKWKAQQVFDNLTRIGRVELTGLPEISGAEKKYYYRNKLEFTFSSKRWLSRQEIDSGIDYTGAGALGFHIPGYFDKILDISECHLQPEPSNSIRNALRVFSLKKGISFYDPVSHSGMLRNVTVRTAGTGQVMVIVVFGSDNRDIINLVMGFLRDEFPSVTSLYYIINPKRNDSILDLEPVLFSGDGHIVEEIAGLRFRIGPKSFFQTNALQAGVLYDIVRKFAGLTGTETVYDLYCGTGTIACFLAANAARVVGLEYIEEAVGDAVRNAGMNNISNVEFISGDIKELLNSSFFRLYGKPEVVIADPPRAGMHPDVIRTLIDASPETIVYISCNPATQARDTSLLTGSYGVEAVRAVDMFPQTYHIENVVKLVRR